MGYRKMFVTCLSDDEAVRLLTELLLDRQELNALKQAKAMVEAWRNYASSYRDYNGSVAWKIRRGFTLKIHAPLVGPCYEGLGYLREWNFADTPTTDCLVFWVPDLLKQSTGKSLTQMEAYRAEQRRFYNLPASHCDRFGSIQLLSALILAHFYYTGERVPPGGLYAISDTLDENGARLIAGDFHLHGLRCLKCSSLVGSGDVSFLLLGVEEFSRPAQALTR